MEFHGDYCGFTFNGVHTTDLGIIRVSDGSRYEETMIPSFQDRTVSIPGADGAYYFDSNYNQKIFTLQLVFDSMTEVQMRRFRQVFNGKSVGELIFDEAPYKAYTAKVQGAPSLKYICFDEAETRPYLFQDNVSNKVTYLGDLYAPNKVLTTGIVYKGEATITFVCYYPYARSVYKWLSYYTNENTAEWAKASGMLGSSRSLDPENPFDSAGTTNPIRLYNPGDLETDWIAFYSFQKSDGSGFSDFFELKRINIFTYDNPFDKTSTKTELGCLIFKDGGFPRLGPEGQQDTYFAINSKTQLIEGYTGTLFTTSLRRSGTIYNEYIEQGDFFKIPLGIAYFGSYTNNAWNVDANRAICQSLRYDYLYY